MSENDEGIRSTAMIAPQGGDTSLGFTTALIKNSPTIEGAFVAVVPPATTDPAAKAPPKKGLVQMSRSALVPLTVALASERYDVGDTVFVREEHLRNQAQVTYRIEETEFLLLPAAAVVAVRRWMIKPRTPPTVAPYVGDWQNPSVWPAPCGPPVVYQADRANGVNASQGQITGGALA